MLRRRLFVWPFPLLYRIEFRIELGAAQAYELVADSPRSKGKADRAVALATTANSPTTYPGPAPPLFPPHLPRPFGAFS